MKLSGIGGQAVIEGIMMRNKDKYSIAVRKPDQEIEVVVRECNKTKNKYKWLNYPIIRGIYSFFESLFIGTGAINFSSAFYEETSAQDKTKIDEIGKNLFKDKFESILMAVTVIVSIFVAVALFMVLPYLASRLLSSVVASKGLLNFFEGIVRVIIFLLYLAIISQLSDIKRTFMYHGAEHKCINCIEHGARLTPENVKNSSRYHKRCGTSFLFVVLFISIVFFIFIRVDNTVAQIIIRILMIPIIAGVSYEFIRWAGKNDTKATRILSKPGMWLQKITTKEPDMDMIEVAIKAVEKVFDWEKFLVEEYYADSTNLVADIEASERELAIASAHVGKRKRTTRSITVEENVEEEKELTAEEKYIKVAKEFEAAQTADTLESVYETINELEQDNTSYNIDLSIDENIIDTDLSDLDGIVFDNEGENLESINEKVKLDTEDVTNIESISDIDITIDDVTESDLKELGIDKVEELDDQNIDDGFTVEEVESGFEFEDVDDFDDDDDNQDMPAFRTRNRK